MRSAGCCLPGGVRQPEEPSIPIFVAQDAPPPEEENRAEELLSGPWRCQLEPPSGADIGATSPTRSRAAWARISSYSSEETFKSRSSLRSKFGSISLQKPLLQSLAKHGSSGSMHLHPKFAEYTWALVFPLPSKITPEQQAKFDNLLQQQGICAVTAIDSAFEFVGFGEVKRAMGEELRYKRGKHDSKRNGEQSSVLARARQCTIELTLACLDLINSAITDLLANNAASDLSPSSPASAEDGQNLQIFKATSNDKDMLFICIRQSIAVAELFADITQYPVQLSHAGIEQLGIKISDRSSTPAYVNYFSEFRNLCRMHRDSYDRGEYSVLRHVDRIRLIFEKLTSYIGLQQLEAVGLIAHSFPLHHNEELERLSRSWGSWRFIFSLAQPLDDVRDYFGEQIAFYFLFLRELTWATCILAIPTVGCLLLRLLGTGDMRPWLGAAIAIWYKGFLLRWRQMESRYALRWGVRAHDSGGCKVRALRNPRFRGEVSPSPENENERRLTVSWCRQVLGRAASLMTTFAFVTFLLCIVSAEHYVFFELTQKHTMPFSANLLAAGLGGFCGVQMVVVDAIWDRMSLYITDLEVWASLIEFEESRRKKAAIVKFITSTGSLIFFAFVQPPFARWACEQRLLSDAEECLRQDRARLEKQLCATFITRYVIMQGAVNDVVKPYIAYKLGRFWRERLKGYEASFTELQMHLKTYTGNTLTEDYLNVILPLGFVIFFGMVYPASVLLLLVSLLFRVRADALKLLNFYRRPYPRIATDIGVFNEMLSVFGHIMLLSNIGLLFADFGGVMHFAPFLASEATTAFRDVWLLNLLLCLLVSLVAVFVWNVLDAALPRVLRSDRLEQRRQDLQRSKLFYLSAFGDLRALRVSLAPERLARRENFARAAPRL